ncbi:MAG: tryptophan-rich sensory protein [Rhodothermales bacterium]|nr:tryptophan-rich sensory protein [Rhodothermales bacterium]MCA0268726.1 tryptophan-rich sensory protein [Bacteroidota bacterium]
MRRYLPLAGFILLCNAAGVIGSLLFADQIRPFYAALTKPPLSPPPTVFGPVWTILYTLMGVAVWRIWQLPASAERTAALRLFAIQLALNALWTPLFFGLQNLWVALVCIAAVLVAIVLTIRAFRPLDATAAWLLVPYLAWVAFATYLNAGVAVLNG